MGLVGRLSNPDLTTVFKSLTAHDWTHAIGRTAQPRGSRPMGDENSAQSETPSFMCSLKPNPISESGKSRRASRRFSADVSLRHQSRTIFVRVVEGKCHSSKIVVETAIA